jgi:hypothetical protein
VDDEHLTRTQRIRHHRIGGTCAAADLDNVTFAGYDPTVAIHDLQRIEPSDEPGRPYEMGPGTTGLRPNAVCAFGIYPASEHANHLSKKPRHAWPPTRCRQVNHAPGLAHLRPLMPANALLLPRQASSVNRLGRNNPAGTLIIADGWPDSKQSPSRSDPVSRHDDPLPFTLASPDRYSRTCCAFG